MNIIDADQIKFHGWNGCTVEYSKGYFDAMEAIENAPHPITDIFTDVECDNDEILIINIDTEICSIDMAVSVQKAASGIYNTDRIAIIPDFVNIRKMKKYEAVQYVEMLQHILDEME